MDNAPQPKLPPTKYNLSRYVAFFPDYQLDNGNVLRTNDDAADEIFSTDYPSCLLLRENPKIPNHDKVYSTNNNSSTKDNLSFSSSEDNEHDALSNDDESDSKHGSYV